MEQAKLSLPAQSKDHVLGSLKAPLILVEYGDFECPYCAAAAPIVEKLLSDFDLSIAYVFRHFPLRDLHPHAELAALAAEAAALQSQFWPMHQLLFENSNRLSMGAVLSFVSDLEMDVGRFQDDFERGDLFAHIESDIRSGIDSDVQGTPTFYLNNFRIDGPTDYNYFKELFEGVLEHQTTRTRPSKEQERFF